MGQAARRLAGEGVDLGGYTIPEVIADLEAARESLGYERIHLLSGSYGTRIAQLYAGLHPERIARSVMVGVNPPGNFVWWPEKIDEQLEYYSKLWAQDPDCAKRAPHLAATLRQVTHHMPRRWFFLPIDPGKVRVVSFSMLFNRRSAALVFDAFAAAGRGDPSGLALMSLAFDFTVPKPLVWGDLLAKGASADFDPQRDYLAELDPPGAILGSPVALLVWGALSDAWPVRLIDAELRRAQPSDVEILLLSGSLDFSTPAEIATQELLPLLSRGKQIIWKELGHVGDLMHFQPEQSGHLISTFFDTGVVDEEACEPVPMDFRVQWGFPRLAKLLLGAAELAVVVLGLMLYRIVL
jgi:pimeloyl-ACP methyl ester carboxylesterase